MRIGVADAIAGLDGVAAVDPQIQFQWDPDPEVGFAVPDLVTGLIPGADAGHETFELELATGRLLTGEDTGNVVVLGSTVAQKHGVIAGDSVEIRLSQPSDRPGDRCRLPSRRPPSARHQPARPRSARSYRSPTGTRFA
jgi:ABC-type lipoprotein release transport system permease subunit